MDFFAHMLWFMLFILTGYVARRLGLANERAMGIISFIILDITLPCTVIKGLNGFHLDVSWLALLAVGFVFNLLFLGIGRVAAGKSDLKMRGFTMLNMTGFNIGMFAMPFLQTFCTPAVFGMICLCDVGNAIMTMGGNYALAARASRTPGMDARTMARIVLTCLGFHCYIVMLTLSVLHISLPETLMTGIGAVARFNPFMCMFMIGLGLRFRLGEGALRLVARLLAIRYACAALLCIPLFLLPLGEKSIVVATCIYLVSPVSGLNPLYTFKMAPEFFKDASMNSCVSIMASTVIFFFLVPALLAYAG